jgi:hypothetical protein
VLVFGKEVTLQTHGKDKYGESDCFAVAASDLILLRRIPPLPAFVAEVATSAE